MEPTTFGRPETVRGDPLAQAADWLDAGRGVALATVVRTWGSSPRPAGSHLAVSDTQEMVGSVSGGCVEGAIVTEAEEVIRSGEPRLLEYGVANETAWSVGLACGGRIEVWLERIGPERELLDRWLAHRDRGEPVVVATDLENGERRLILPGSGEHALDAAAAEALAADETRITEIDGRRRMLRPYLPPRRLLVVGAVHVAQSLARLAPELGFEVVIVDPREAFATARRFPATRLVVEWPDAALERLAPGRESAIVLLTHDPKLDDPGLEVALQSEAFYIGALGSRRTHAARLERFRERGFEDSELERVHGPVGLSIGARSPAEIATSILAEIVSVLRSGTR